MAQTTFEMIRKKYKKLKLKKLKK